MKLVTDVATERIIPSNATFTTPNMHNAEYFTFSSTSESGVYSLLMYYSATGFLSKQGFAQTFPHNGTCLQLAFMFTVFLVDFSTEPCPNFFSLPINRKCLPYWNVFNFF